MMTVEGAQAAEVRVLRALRLVAFILRDSMSDMCVITNMNYDGTPPEIWEAREKAWANASKLLRLTIGTISNIHDDKGPAFEGHPDLVDHCEEAIKELEAQQLLARSLRFTKRIEKENLKLRDQA